jgi:hypothetical protein
MQRMVQPDSERFQVADHRSGTDPARLGSMSDDAIVQAIRIAVTLTEQLRQRMAGYDATIDEAQLRIGEAQALVPELWRNLDEARAGLTARGIDTSAFDAIRAAQPAAMLAAANPEIVERPGAPMAGPDLVSGVVPGAIHEVSGWDTSLAQRAARACEALMTALPEVDWAALAARDKAIEAEARDALGVSRGGWIVLWGLLVVIALVFIAAFVL